MNLAINPKENSWLWLAKIVTGVLVIVLILVHLVVNHIVVEGGLLSYADIVTYFSHPWVVVMETCFLTIVVSHSLLGLRSVFLDIHLPNKIQYLIDRLLVVLGIITVIYGFWLTQVIVSRGNIG